MMTTKIFSQVLALAVPSRKTENLIVLLGSILRHEQVFTGDSADTCLKNLCSNLPALLLIDHSISKPEIARTIQEARSKNPQVFIILLLSHPQSDSNVSDLDPDGIIYDGFSPDSLLALLSEPQAH